MQILDLIGVCKYNIHNMITILYLHPPTKFRIYKKL